VPTDRLAELSDQTSFERAAALPIAGLTALHLLEVAGSVAGKRVLVTGAAGGVGRFAIQLASRAGAHVTGVVRDWRRGEGLRELGAEELITELTPGAGEDYDVILESVGGASLGAALNRVAPGGIVISFGNTVPDPASFDVDDFYHCPGARLYAFEIFHELGRERPGSADLRHLAHEVAAGHLDPGVSLVGSWRDPGPLLEALIERRVSGKAVLTIDETVPRYRPRVTATSGATAPVPTPTPIRSEAPQL
jgi:NADPH:quinone reductase